MPKSASFAVPSCVTSTLDGLTSRCTMPAAWAAARASATWAEQRRGLVRQQAAGVLGQHGEVRAVDVLHHQPLLVPLGDEVEDGHHVRVVELRGQLGLALGAQQVRRAAARELPTRLTATSRPSTWSTASQTAPMPPWPIWRRST